MHREGSRMVYVQGDLSVGPSKGSSRCLLAGNLLRVRVGQRTITCWLVGHLSLAHGESDEMLGMLDGFGPLGGRECMSLLLDGLESLGESHARPLCMPIA